MASVLAIVSKAVFDKLFRDADVGRVLPATYASRNKALETLREGGALFLVTVRPGERLWLVAILESPKFSKSTWSATNATPITDITGVLPELELEHGVGITFKKGALGMTLQSPRRLADAGADRLRALAKPSKKTTKPPAKNKTTDVVSQLAEDFDEDNRAAFLDSLVASGDRRAELATLEAQWIASNGTDNAIGGKLYRAQKRLAREFGQRYRFKSAKLGFSHGILVEVEARPQFFMDQGAELFANEPIRSISLFNASVKHLPKLAAIPALQRVSWVAIDREPALVAAALTAFPNASISVKSCDPDDIDAIFALPGSKRVRGLTLSFPKRAELKRYAKHKSLAKLERLDVDDYVCSMVAPEYREETDAAAILKLGWKLSWVTTSTVSVENLNKLRAGVRDVVVYE